MKRKEVEARRLLKEAIEFIHAAQAAIVVGNYGAARVQANFASGQAGNAALALGSLANKLT